MGVLEHVEELVGEHTRELRVVGATSPEHHVRAATLGGEAGHAAVKRPVLGCHCHRVAGDGFAVLTALSTGSQGVDEIEIYLAVAVTSWRAVTCGVRVWHGTTHALRLGQRHPWPQVAADADDGFEVGAGLSLVQSAGPHAEAVTLGAARWCPVPIEPLPILCAQLP